MRELTDEDREVTAAIAAVLPHLGAASFQMRYQDDATPVVWIAIAEFPNIGPDGEWAVAAATTPGLAAWRLAESLIDGGDCQVCGKGTALIHGEESLPAFLASEICSYRYRAGRIVRGCDSRPMGTKPG